MQSELDEASNGGPQKAGPPASEEPHFHGHRERLRDRFRKAGGEALADYELIELILFRAMPIRSALQILPDAAIASNAEFSTARSLSNRDALA